MAVRFASQLKQYSDIEKCQVMALLDDAARQSNPYDGDWTAPWLHNPIHALNWLVSQKHGTRMEDGKLIGVYQIAWGINLPDGSSLADSKNLAFLHMLQKLAFLSREAPVGKAPPNSTTHISFIHFLLIVARWMYLHKELFDPEREMFRRIDRSALHDFLYKYSQGGAAFVLCYPERILTALYQTVLEHQPSRQILDEPFSIPDEDRNRIGKWLLDNDYIAIIGRDKVPYLSRKKIAVLLGGVSISTFTGHRINAFLQYLTPGCNTPLLISSDLRTEYPSQRVPLFIDAIKNISATTSLRSPLAQWRELISMNKHMPASLPPSECFKQKELTNLINRLGARSGHTPWVPLKTALAYTTESLRWVHMYGEDLVTLFLDVYRKFHKEGILDLQKFQERKREAISLKRDELIRDAIPESLAALNISGYRSSLSEGAFSDYADYSKLRSSPSLPDAISVLLGAIITLIGITKPIRQDEIRNLGRNCVSVANREGYWIDHEQGKQNIEDVLAESSRPIPTITAKALLLVRRLSDGIKEITGVTDKWLLERLFVLPELGGLLRDVNCMSRTQTARYLNIFCDYVGLPVDKYQRRWYLRVHETRKSFLITFFWCFRFASLDAARWIAGHTDAQHIYAYIQANFPGEELPAIEAEYATQVMFDFESIGDRGEVENIQELYRAVCRHFNVTVLSLVDEDELKDWLELQFAKGKFQILPYSIESDDGAINTQIAFKLNSTENANGQH